MNIAFFITPKSQVAYLYDDYTVRQCLEKMRFHGYTAIPVIDRSGRYVGTLSEGDLLWRLVGEHLDEPQLIDIKSTENIDLRDVMHPDRMPPARITATIEELLLKSQDQNFIPVIDDKDVFIGIVTRKNIIRYFSEHPVEEKLNDWRINPMPIYRFYCQGCRQEFEVNRPLADLENNNIACPNCGGKELKRRYGSFGVHMKCNPPTCPHDSGDGGCCGGCCCH